MKMRPSHPLPELSGRHKSDATNKKHKKKPGSFDVPTRARVRTIDPRSFGAVHLREDMLDAILESQPLQVKKHSLSFASCSLTPSLTMNVVHQSPEVQSVIEDNNSGISDFEKEKARDLGLLTSIFEDDETQWGGKETMADASSDVMDKISDVSTTEEIKPSEKTVESKYTSPSPVKQKPQSLKDMFKPHEEEGSSCCCRPPGID